MSGQVKYKLTYFNQRARGEPIRLIFAAAKVPYEDFRIEKSGWGPLKEDYPWGHLPLLEVDGVKLAESSAICRFLGERFHLAGDSEWDAAKCDEYVSAMMDLRTNWLAFLRESDQERKAKLRKEFLEEHVPKNFEKFDKILSSSGGDFLLGEKYTWADLHVAHNFAFFEECVDSTILSEYPRLAKFVGDVFAIPQITKWVETRPQNSDKAIFFNK